MTSDGVLNPGCGCCGPYSAAFSAEAGGGWQTADRDNSPFINDVDPAGTPLRGQLRSTTATFAEREWWAKWWSYLAVHDFMGTPWRLTVDGVMAAEWAKVDPAANPVGTMNELGQLANLAATDRADAM